MSEQKKKGSCHCICLLALVVVVAAGIAAYFIVKYYKYYKEKDECEIVQCTNNCGHCVGNRTCIDGTCADGCLDGYYGTRCEKECESGYHGFNCSRTCGKCNNGTCSHTNGHCENGCQPGYSGLVCKDECRSGYYGEKCANTCGNCVNTEACSPIDGKCKNGCQTGYGGFYCKDETGKASNNKSQSIYFVLVLAALSLVVKYGCTSRMSS